MFTFVGDVHGKFKSYFNLTKHITHPVIQLGDMGIGFGEEKQNFPSNHKWIRGNHNHVKLCKTYSSYLGDYGMYENMFYCGGAWSIDWAYRTEGINWWKDEQLSEEDLSKAYELYVKTKPKVVYTHDCPLVVFNHTMKPNRTNVALQDMWEAHRPELWLFGHHHVSLTKLIQGTTFKCLDELEVYEY